MLLGATPYIGLTVAQSRMQLLLHRIQETYLALIGEIRFKDTPNTNEGMQWYFVRSVSNNSIETEASDIVAFPVATAREGHRPSRI